MHLLSTSDIKLSYAYIADCTIRSTDLVLLRAKCTTFANTKTMRFISPKYQHRDRASTLLCVSLCCCENQRLVSSAAVERVKIDV